LICAEYSAASIGGKAGCPWPRGRTRTLFGISFRGVHGHG